MYQALLIVNPGADSENSLFTELFLVPDHTSVVYGPHNYCKVDVDLGGGGGGGGEHKALLQRSVQARCFYLMRTYTLA